AHDRGQNAGEAYAGDRGMKELCREPNEDGLAARAFEGRVDRKHSDEPDDDRRGEHGDDPGHRDTPGRLELVRAPNRHEPGEDVRLTGIAQAPAEQRYDAEHPERVPAGADERIEQRGIARVDRIERGSDAARK